MEDKKKQQNDIFEQAKNEVFEILKNGKIKNLLYHDYNHTLGVVDAAKLIAENSGCTNKEVELAILAAWFHDTGYVSKYTGHEEVSVDLAEKFLKKNGYLKEEVELVSNAIAGTHWPQEPTNKIGQILCDADMSHFGSKDYFEKSEILRLEWELTGNLSSDFVWPESEIKFLSEHKYLTEFAEKEYTKRKRKNILKLKEIENELLVSADEDEKKREKDKTKKTTPERGIETMFRITYSNQMSLSAIADNKANIMLSINAIIISICLSTLIPNFDDNPTLIIPTAILILMCVLTIIFATLSTRPKITKGTFSKDDVLKQKPNLLFFGNFHAMQMGEYQWGMEELMKSKDYLYSSMIKDIYSLGTVLANKYKYLRICYGVFMFGMIASVLAFTASLFF